MVFRFQITKPNTRPDVTIKRTDSKIDQIEVRSRTDDPKMLEARMKAKEILFPSHMQGGKNRVVEFTREIPK